MAREREKTEKRSAIERIAQGIAPSVWLYSSDMAKVILDDFAEREKHPYLVIQHTNNEVFYYHRESPPGPEWLYQFRIFELRTLEVPVVYKNETIATIRTTYVSNLSVQYFVIVSLTVLLALLLILGRRTMIVTLSRTQTRADLEEAQLRLVGNDRLLFFSHMATKLAHEFNTPLGIIITAQSFLSDQGSGVMDTEDGRQTLRMIGNAAHRMKGLIKRMQDTVPDSSSEEISTVNISSLITGLIMNVREDNDNITVNIPDNLEWLSRIGIITLVIEELIKNASQHGRDTNGILTLTINSRIEEGMLKLEFTDAGAGISSRIEGQLYAPFISTQPGQPGSGLGLYLARNFTIHRLEGTINHETSENGGTRFCVILPNLSPEK